MMGNLKMCYHDVMGPHKSLNRIIDQYDVTEPKRHHDRNLLNVFHTTRNIITNYCIPCTIFEIVVRLHRKL